MSDRRAVAGMGSCATCGHVQHQHGLSGRCGLCRCDEWKPKSLPVVADDVVRDTPEPTDDDALRQFLLTQFKRDEATARAMPHAIEGLQSRWSPEQLITDCAAKTAIVEAMPACRDCGRGQRCVLHDASAGQPTWRFLRPEDRATAELLARKYEHLRGGRRG